MSHSVKVISAIVILTAIIIGTSLAAHGVLDRSAMDLQKSIYGVEAAAAAGDWKSAESGLKLIKGKWNGVSGMWSMLVDHQEIDNIEFTLSRMEKFITTKEKASALAETSALLGYVNHIPVKERLSLRNVL